MSGKRSFCRGVTVSGGPCKIEHDLSDEGYCIWHDPKRTGEAKRRQSLGGQRGGGHNRYRGKTVKADETPSKPETLDDCVEWASWTAVAVATGKIDARTSKEIVLAIRELRSSLEKRDLMHEVDRLKKELAAVRRPRVV